MSSMISKETTRMKKKTVWSMAMNMTAIVEILETSKMRITSRLLAKVTKSRKFLVTTLPFQLIMNHQYHKFLLRRIYLLSFLLHQTNVVNSTLDTNLNLQMIVMPLRLTEQCQFQLN